MKWTVLSDNRTNDSQFETEHGLSILLETDKHHILLDTGASDVFIRNAEKMGIDLSTVDYVFISHGHSDHAGGLKHFLNINERAKVVVSPDAVNGKVRAVRLNCSMTASGHLSMSGGAKPPKPPSDVLGHSLSLCGAKVTIICESTKKNANFRAKSDIFILF